MIKSLLKIGVLLIIGILAYNYFLGSEKEKAQSEEIFGEVRELGKAAWGLLKSEKEKFDEGKYDEAVDKIGNLFESLREKARDIKDSGALDKLAELEKKRKELEVLLAEPAVETYDDTAKKEAREEGIKNELEKLLEETEQLMKEMEEKK